MDRQNKSETGGGNSKNKRTRKIGSNKDHEMGQEDVEENWKCYRESA